LLLCCASASAGILSLSLHDALPILEEAAALVDTVRDEGLEMNYQLLYATELYFLEDYDAALRICDTLYLSLGRADVQMERHRVQDRKSTRLNSSHVKISYAVFCLKK